MEKHSLFALSKEDFWNRHPCLDFLRKIYLRNWLGVPVLSSPLLSFTMIFYIGTYIWFLLSLIVYTVWEKLRDFIQPPQFAVRLRGIPLTVGVSPICFGTQIFPSWESRGRSVFLRAESAPTTVYGLNVP